MANTAGGLNDAAFGCAGQRCMAGSTAVLIGKAADRLINPLSEIVSKIQVGPTDRGSGGTMGAVISPSHRDRVRQLLENGVRDGAELIIDGRGVDVPEEPNGFYMGPSILDRVESGMEIAREEVFGPVLNLMRFDDLEAAIELANNTPFGNGACIYTQSAKRCACMQNL